MGDHQMSMEAMDAACKGQKKRDTKMSSQKRYISAMNSISRSIMERSNEEFIAMACLLDAAGKPQYHIGDASNIVKLKMPIEKRTWELLFALLASDHMLASKKSREYLQADAIHVTSSCSNPAANIATCAAQTYQNFQSALKWWIRLDEPDMDKVGSSIPSDVAEVCRTLTQSII